MDPETSDPTLHERVLVAAPVGRDAELTVSVLTRAGVAAAAVSDVSALIAELPRGAGLVLLTAEVLTDDAVAALAAAISRQPPWSDLPVLVFTPSRDDGDAGILDRLEPLGNVTLVDRPVRIATLVSLLKAALRARRRQYLLRDLLHELRAGVRQRDEFLAMLGHELRNPLGALSTALQILDHAGADPSPASLEMIPRQNAVVRRQVQVLGRLVDDLLEVSRVTSGKLALKKARLDLAELVRRGGESLRPMAQSHRVKLTIEAPASPVTVDGDSTRLEQVVVNLLTNAIKYTPQGGRIDVALRSSGGRATLSVKDTGMGMAPEVLPGIFDLFQQADRTLNRAQGGMGIGLTLVRSIVELHGGTVVARSAGLGQGSEFLVVLPTIAGDVAESAAADPPAAASTATRRVFVLEDNDDNREGLVILLQQFGHEVASDEDGLAGARRIIETRPEVALIDIGLPGLDGYEVARQVRGALGASVTLIALTGYGTEDDRERALLAGFDGHLAKPIDFLALRRMLAQADPPPAKQLVR